MAVLPSFTSAGVLPAGEHPGSWTEIVDRFGGAPKRDRLLVGLRAVARSLRDAGASRLWLDGSFVTDTNDPNDFDGVWDPVGVDLAKVDPVLLDRTDLATGRHRQKAKYGGELLVGIEAGSGLPFQDFFQFDKNGDPKGIVVLELRTVP